MSAIRWCLILSSLVMLVGFAGALDYTFQTTGNAFDIYGDDGVWHPSPWTVSWADGQTKTVSVPCGRYPTDVRYYIAFTSWSGAITSPLNQIIITTGPTTAGTYTANFDTRYLLMVNPASITASPASTDGNGYYHQGTPVHLTAPAINGYAFDHWEVDGSGGYGTTPALDITMNIYHSVEAVYTATTGSIAVTSTPPAASVYLDGSYNGTSPVTMASVSPGTHTIKLTKPGYQDWQQSVQVVAGQTTSVTAPMTAVVVLNGSGVGVYRPSIRTFILKNGTEKTVVGWGLATDTPVTGDWNGDGLADVGVHRPSIQKFILKNGTEKTVVSWGLGTDTPITGDWNGDGFWDVGVFRPSIQKFILKNGTERTVIAWGLNNDTPVSGDWNGDGLWDIGVYRQSIQQFILKNGTETTVVPWGLETDIPVSGDWDGDSLTDIGVYRPSLRKFILKNGAEQTMVPWGLETDIPVTGKWR